MCHPTDQNDRAISAKSDNQQSKNTCGSIIKIRIDGKTGFHSDERSSNDNRKNPG